MAEGVAGMRLEDLLEEDDLVRFRAQVRDEVMREVRERIATRRRRWRSIARYFAKEDCDDSEAMSELYQRKAATAGEILCQLNMSDEEEGEEG